MKNKTSFTKTLLLSLAMIFLSTITMESYAQKESKQERKAREAQEQEAQFIVAKKAMMDTAFLVSGQSLQFRDSGVIPVTGTLNFVQLIGNKSVLQIGSEVATAPGLNNLGGFTLKGDATNIKISEKKDRIYLTYTLTGLIGTARIAVTIVGSDMANVDVDGMFSGKAFTMRGALVSPGDRNTFEGTEF